MKISQAAPLMLSAVMFAFSFYEFLLWTRRKERLRELALCAACLFMGIYDVLVSQLLGVTDLASSIRLLRFMVCADAMALYCLLWFISEYIGHMYYKVLAFFGGIVALTVLSQLFSPTDLVWARPTATSSLPQSGPVTIAEILLCYVLLAYLIASLVRHAQKGKSREALSFIAMILLSGFALSNDVAVGMGLSPLPLLTHWAWLFLLFFTMYHLSEELLRENALRTELARSRELLASFVDQSMESIIISDETGRIVEFNRASEELSGLRRDEVLGRYFWDIAAQISMPGDYGPDFAAQLESEYRELLRTGSGPNLAKPKLISLRRADGTDRYFQQTLFVIQTGEGRFRLGCINHDITEVKQFQRALFDSEARYRGIFESLQDVYFRSDARGRIEILSPSIQTSFGYRPETLIGKRVDSFISTAAERRSFLRSLNATGQLNDYRISGLGPEGRRYEASISCHLIFDGQGRRTGVEGVIRDIGDRVAAEKKLVASLGEKEVLLKEVHHRVKNNLQIISSLLHLHESKISDTKALSVIEDCRSQVLTMALVHEDLFQSEDLASIDLGNYLRNLVARLFAANPRGIRTAFEGRSETNRVDIEHAIPCGLIVNELCTNAMKHAFAFEAQRPSEAPEIRVGLKRIGEGRLALVVKDNGVGLPEGFVGGDESSLGLKIVKLLAEQLNGKLEMGSEKGAWFRVEFPLSTP